MTRRDKNKKQHFFLVLYRLERRELKNIYLRKQNNQLAASNKRKYKQRNNNKWVVIIT